MKKIEDKKTNQPDKTEQESKESTVSPDLLHHLFEPDDDRLPELTDIPLNQVNPLSWMVVYEEATKQLAESAQRSIDKNKEKNERPVLLSSIWRKFFYKHRRSLENQGRMIASTLAMKQLEMKEFEGEGTDPYESP